MTASTGDGQAVLTWNAAQGAVAYSVYQGTEAVSVDCEVDSLTIAPSVADTGYGIVAVSCMTAWAC
ncbi:MULTISPECIES: hypothetical protein [Paenibacillus]|uniref:hypothetical protein n=1 Tax=Paenibacillus TaxID=44249 RepID=UPI000403C57B|nr:MULTISPECIES: hypothetical protein [Paenibacillus]